MSSYTPNTSVLNFSGTGPTDGVNTPQGSRIWWSPSTGTTQLLNSHSGSTVMLPSSTAAENVVALPPSATCPIGWSCTIVQGTQNGTTGKTTILSDAANLNGILVTGSTGTINGIVPVTANTGVSFPIGTGARAGNVLSVKYSGGVGGFLVDGKGSSTNSAYPDWVVT